MDVASSLNQVRGVHLRTIRSRLKLDLHTRIDDTRASLNFPQIPEHDRNIPGLAIPDILPAAADSDELDLSEDLGLETAGHL